MPGSHPALNKVLHGEHEDDQFGWSAGTAGDVNGDGYADIIVSAPNFDQGKVYVYYGSSGIEASPGFTATGELALDFFGSAVAGAGDVNGDGYDDIIVSAKGFDHDTGKVYIYHGGPSGLNETQVFTEVGQDATSNFGVAVAGRATTATAMPMLSSVRRSTRWTGSTPARSTSIWAAPAGWLSLRPSSPRARMPAT